MAARNSTKAATIPAVSYLRMSSDKQTESIPAQRKAVKAYAKENGYRIIREYVDSGISGDDTIRRLEFQRMIADAASGEFKAILCWDQDRFGRFDSVEAGHWIYPLRQAGVSLVTLDCGPIDRRAIRRHIRLCFFPAGSAAIGRNSWGRWPVWRTTRVMDPIPQQSPRWRKCWPAPNVP